MTLVIFILFFIFSDSLAHLNASLAELVDDIRKEDEAIAPLKKYVDEHLGGGEEKLECLLRKGVYPYSHMSNPAAYEETCLPPIEAFHDDLRDEKCSEEDYRHAQKVWTLFDMKTMKDYCEFYVKADALQLDAVFQRYRAESLKSYKIDPIHYFTLPG